MTDNVRFLQNNLAAADGATITSGGYTTGFPASDAVNPYRYKKWLPAGSFHVESTNKKIYINDGSNKTITLTEGWYNTGTLLAAHIQTQLNASSSNWTCTYSTTTYKFTLARSSGTKTIRLTQTTDASWDMLGYTGAADVNAYTADEVRIHTAECWFADLGSAQTPTAFIVIGPADSVFDVPVTATCTLKADNVNSFGAGSSPAFSVTLTVTTNGIAYFPASTLNTTYRYWEFKIIDRTNPEGPSYSINQIYLGDYVTPELHNFNTGFSRTLVDQSTLVRAVSGVKHWRRSTKFWRYDAVSIDWLSDTDRVALEEVIALVGTSEPFFISLDPGAEVSEDSVEFTKYVTFASDSKIEQLRWKYYKIDFSMEEVI